MGRLAAWKWGDMWNRTSKSPRAFAWWGMTARTPCRSCLRSMKLNRECCMMAVYNCLDGAVADSLPVYGTAWGDKLAGSGENDDRHQYK